MSLNNDNKGKTFEQLEAELFELKLAYGMLKAEREAELQKYSVQTNTMPENIRFYSDLFNHSSINYQALDKDGNIVIVSPGWLQSLGYSPEEVIGQHFSKFFSKKSAELFVFQFLNNQEPGKTCSFEFELIHKDGSHLIVGFEGTTVKNEISNLTYSHCTWIDITSKKQAEEKMRIKDWAIESAIAAIAISDLDGHITYVNPAFQKLWGYNSPDEILGKPVISFWLAEDKAEEVISKIKKSGSWYGELEAIHKNGSTFHVEVSANIVRNLAGDPVNMLASFEDITEHRQAVALQAESEISYRELYNNVADAIYILDENGTFLDVNDGAVKMYGFPREILVGKNPSFVSAPGKNDLDAVLKMIKKALDGESQQFEFWGKRANGETFLKDVRMFPGKYFGRNVLIAMAQDITDRKKAEIALQESERRFRELIELAVDGILLGAPDGSIIGANSYMQKLTGRPLDKLIGININDIFDPNTVLEMPFRYDLLKKGETVFSERNLLHMDGTSIPIEMHTKMMPNGSYQSIFRNVTERKKAEEILRESEIKFKSLVESTSDIIWETNIEGKYTYISPQLENLLGYTPQEAIGKSPFDFIVNENIKEIIDNSDSIVKKASPFSAHVNKYKHRNGHILFFETSGVPVFNASGKLSGYRGISRDITQRYLAEKELHKLSLVVHQSPNTVIITNLEGKMEYVNPAGCANSGYSTEELIGKSPSIFRSGITSFKTYESLWKTIKSGEEWRGVFHNRKKNGELYWESAFIVPLRDAEGNIMHYLGVKEDITNKLKAETALKESEERYRQLFEGSPDAIILADIETGMLMDANATACNLLGRSLDEIRKMHQTMIHPPVKKAFAVDAFQEHVSSSLTSEPARTIESFVLRSDGQEIPVDILASVITIGGRQILQGVFRNITERKLAQEELLKAKEKAEASDKLKSAFLNNISHELRTPLNGIIGFSEMLIQMDNTEEDRHEFSKMIKRSSSRLINTITSYMDMSMIVSGITDINKGSFSLNQFLEKINKHTIETCTSHNNNLKVNTIAPEGETEITTDENLLTKIFEHIIDNAVKFTKEGSITIGYKPIAGNHQFYVSDTGKGISEESLSVIFEVFMQADLSTSRGYEGSGVGLSIAKGFVKLLGGEMWVESQSGKGSTFYFSVPSQKAIQYAKKEAVQNQPNTDQPVILVAEDEDSNYKYIEIVLKKAGYKVIRATNGFETIERCRSHPEIASLLMDMKMPGMDGLEATRQIRKTLPYIPIIALSAYVSSEDEEKAIKAGCNEYIIKPVNKIKLLETLSKVIKAGDI